MKNLKIVFASLCLLALTTIFATKASAQISTAYYEYTGSGGFTLSSGTDGQLTTQGNWTSRTSSNLPNCGNNNLKICYIQVDDYVDDPNPPAEEPTLATVLSTLATDYNDSNHTFASYSGTGNSFTITVSSGGTTQYIITVFLKP